MGFEVAEFKHNNFTYNNTYHRVGVFRFDKKRKIGIITVYVYKNKQTRDENVNSFFTTLMLNIKENRFNNYFNNYKCFEICAYTYLKNNYNKTQLDYTNATPIFDSQEQEELFNAFVDSLNEEEESEED